MLCACEDGQSKVKWRSVTFLKNAYRQRVTISAYCVSLYWRRWGSLETNNVFNSRKTIYFMLFPRICWKTLELNVRKQLILNNIRLQRWVGGMCDMVPFRREYCRALLTQTADCCNLWYKRCVHSWIASAAAVPLYGFFCFRKLHIVCNAEL